jgi:hypothetical protein
MRVRGNILECGDKELKEPDYPYRRKPQNLCLAVVRTRNRQNAFQTYLDLKFQKMMDFSQVDLGKHLHLFKGDDVPYASLWHDIGLRSLARVPRKRLQTGRYLHAQRKADSFRPCYGTVGARKPSFEGLMK